MVSLVNLLKIAQEASIEAGKKILEVYQTDFAISYKADHSPLTWADSQANQIIMSYLEPVGIPIISEENKQLPYSHRKNWEYCWLVDPLDGTKEFIHKNDEFTVNIALIKNGMPIMGVIYIPVKKELFYGTINNGAFKIKNITHSQDLDKHQPIPLNPKLTTQEMVVVASKSHLSKETEDFIDEIKSNKKFESVSIISAGSSLKLCMIAEGMADIYPRLSPTMEWDIAAGHAICEAAGVEVVEIDTHKNLTYNKENLYNASFVVKKKQEQGTLI